MRKFKTIAIFYLIVLLGGNSLSAQNRQSRFDFSFGLGVSIPVGAFGQSDTQEALQRTENDFQSRFQGISKRQNGFAQIGSQYHFRVGARVLGINLSARYEQANHGIKRNKITNFIQEAFNAQIAYRQEDYERSALLFGISKRVSLFKIQMEVAFLAGTSTLNFPEYSYADLVFTDGSFTRFSADNSDLTSFTYGFEARVKYPISKRFSAGGFLNFQRADGYEYFYDMIYRPGGSTLLEFTDEVTYRKLDLGVFLSVDF